MLVVTITTYTINFTVYVVLGRCPNAEVYPGLSSGCGAGWWRQGVSSLGGPGRAGYYAGWRIHTSSQAVPGLGPLTGNTTAGVTM